MIMFGRTKMQMTLAEQLDAAEDGEQFKTVLNNLFGFLEKEKYDESA